MADIIAGYSTVIFAGCNDSSKKAGKLSSEKRKFSGEIKESKYGIKIDISQYSGQLFEG